MNKSLRAKVYAKYSGRCAYTGKPLGEDWQVDHVISKYGSHWDKTGTDINDIINLMPALAIVNHYKRVYDLEGFRKYMMNFHKRLAKLPKHTSLEKTRKRIKYMHKVADAFDITVDNPFSGKFYFETINNK